MSSAKTMPETPNGTIDLTLDDSVLSGSSSVSRNPVSLSLRSRLRSSGPVRPETNENAAAPVQITSQTLGDVLATHSTPKRRKPNPATNVDAARPSPSDSPDVQFVSESTELTQRKPNHSKLPCARPNLMRQSTINEFALQSPAESGFACPICFDTRDKIISSGRVISSTLCGHVYCSECLNTAVTSQGRCPTCRKKITKRSIHRLYL